MENIEIKIMNDEELERVSGGLENPPETREMLNRIDRGYTPFPHDRIIMTNYGFKSPCLHRVRIKGIDNLK